MLEVQRARLIVSFASYPYVSIKNVLPVLTLTVVLIVSLTYGSLVNQVLYCSSNKSVYKVSTGLFYIGVQSIHRLMDGKQWNEVFLYPGVSKAFSRTTPQKAGICPL